MLKKAFFPYKHALSPEEAHWRNHLFPLTFYLSWDHQFPQIWRQGNIWHWILYREICLPFPGHTCLEGLVKLFVGITEVPWERQWWRRNRFPLCKVYKVCVYVLLSCLFSSIWKCFKNIYYIFLGRMELLTQTSPEMMIFGVKTSLVMTAKTGVLRATKFLW